ncbi:inosine/xanthosine triphosphatase [Prolixibacteraceae bacterium Z1-6]|uniref:Probable inosine/xanthosine triphosphatase n=1 Tax=Draconibacterium aestuarii TaxID=2998507 RepID=A0A9X3J7E9_9BACT|nr:inosine/xanthosine triphosphatase [Prolixibacteraceae bacterium Z1-6]
MNVVVASKNPVKIEATRLGFESYFTEVNVQGITIESDVADQPVSDEETLRGARNRAEAARKLYADADYWVGIEGGIEARGEGLTAFAWMVITGKENLGESRTTSFQIPNKVVELINQGYELGEANDILFKKENSKQKSGAVGILTNDTITRTELYKQAVQLALIPFLNPGLY